MAGAEKQEFTGRIEVTPAQFAKMQEIIRTTENHDLASALALKSIGWTDEQIENGKGQKLEVVVARPRRPKPQPKIVDMTASMRLLPPAPDKCQVCASDHEPQAPHNKQSLYYQMAFYRQHGVWPTWADAMAHCDERLQSLWRSELIKRGEVIGTAIDAHETSNY